VFARGCVCLFVCALRVRVSGGDGSEQRFVVLNVADVTHARGRFVLFVWCCSVAWCYVGLKALALTQIAVCDVWFVMCTLCE